MLVGKTWAFIHIPKCGGNAVRYHLNGLEVGGSLPLGSSCPIYSPLHRLPTERPRGQVFAFIRHPAAWLRSYWLDQSPDRIEIERFLHRFWSDDLDEFVANVCRRNPGYVGKLYRASLRWEGIKIFKLEDGITPALDWLGIKYTEVPVVNKSPDGPVLGIETRALITRSEGWTMKRFGFTE